MRVYRTHIHTNRERASLPARNLRCLSGLVQRDSRQYRLCSEMRIAVVGTGISGLGAAWLLAPRHDVHVFERESRVGGHTHTHRVDGPHGSVALDSGFIVYNEETYPLLTKLLAALGVRSQPIDMSFSFECERCRLVYSGLGLGGVLADPRNAVRPGFLKFLASIQRFHAAGRRSGATRDAPTLRDFVAKAGSEVLGRHYAYPLASALWSTGIPSVERFPADMFVDFFRRHRLFQLRGRLQWLSIPGGSSTYVRAMLGRLEERVHTGFPVRSVVRREASCRLHFADGTSQEFDRVILATHADEALAILQKPSDAERELLGAWRYATNETWVHSDPAFLPSRAAAYASWNYHVSDCRNPSPVTTMTYNLNRLQRLDPATPRLVTLNPSRPPNRVHDRVTYTHPVYTVASAATRSSISALNGERGTYFCGAYLGFGFHEDGFQSAVEAAEQLGATLE
ncbi:MAG: FAD-dependent oxidoreductase [Acidimicrobiaceae bacterium]|nr:FAD-dependent oxidoreductase [Acidimicrobiaceae bacterium]